MPVFGKTSMERLSTCEPPLIKLLNFAIQRYDFTILTGHRNERDQTVAYEEGRSKTPWPESKHNSFPSRAVDVAPWLPQRGKGRQIPWPEKPDFSLNTNSAEFRGQMDAFIRDWGHWYYLKGYLLACANILNIEIRGGEDWDRDKLFTDQSFHDLPHIELMD